ncbi:MAG: thiol-disulfide oxidoreductase DCC family protein [Lewinellaceae bacterium]|nr:thiol-disulfide oxidoreductase DCC family protein [Lewinella sp.]MCB9277989.1 thiol-disulfide oxidoreductase DCC family protein [Lewinellaceae bacterium]
MKDQDHPILLFDGVCNLCNGFVQFVIKRDKKAVFRFAALQSDLGKELSATAGLPAHSMDTVVLYENNRFYTHSDVGLRVARRLNGLWPLAYALVIIPKFIRDGIYNWVAKNRYRWFGKRESCMVPTPELRSRFLDSVKKVHS